jgi:hypothetical protein
MIFWKSVTLSPTSVCFEDRFLRLELLPHALPFRKWRVLSTPTWQDSPPISQWAITNCKMLLVPLISAPSLLRHFRSWGFWGRSTGIRVVGSPGWLCMCVVEDVLSLCEITSWFYSCLQWIQERSIKVMEVSEYIFRISFIIFSTCLQAYKFSGFKFMKTSGNCVILSACVRPYNTSVVSVTVIKLFGTNECSAYWFCLSYAFVLSSLS